MKRKYAKFYKAKPSLLLFISQVTLSAVKNYNSLFSITVLFNIMLFTGLAVAQNTVTGAFQGDVSSRTGEVVTTAAVVITNEQTATTYNLTTDSSGRFYQGLLAPGFYTIQVKAAGYRTQLLRREIKVSLTGDVVPVPVRLELLPPPDPSAPPVPLPTTAEEANNIRVEINTSDGRRDGSFRQDELRRLPLGGMTITRTFDELALLLPGVAPPPQTIGDVAGPGVGPGVGSAGQFSVNGLRSRGNNFTVDGSDNNDEDIGVRRQGFVALIPQPIESIQEYQVITLLAPAQFGRNLGAQVNAVSKQGSTDLHGALYGFFNSNRLNARNFFDTTNGTDISSLRTQMGQTVLLDGQPLTIRNQSGAEDTFSSGQAGGTLGGALIPNKLFYFLSGEYQKINATREKSFAVPTIEQRGAFGTGASGVFRNPFNNAPISAVPNTINSAAIFSLFPFANNPTGIYEANTFTQIIPASGRGALLSGRLDENFKLGGKQQQLTGRYNFTDDKRQIPSVNEAIFSTLLSKIRTQNLSLFLNSQLNNSTSGNQLFNQVRLSFGRTRLSFNEVRDREFLIPSDELPNSPFLLNSPLRFNATLPSAPGMPNTGPVIFRSALIGFEGPPIRTAETLIGPIGQVNIAGFSQLGTDVYNFPQQRVNNTYQFADELTNRFNNHKFVLGADTRRTDLISDLPRLARSLVTFNGSPRLIPLGNGGFRFPTANDPNPIIRPEDLAGLEATSNFLFSFNVDGQDAEVNLRFFQLNFYAQDTWRVKTNLSLYYGIRYEYNTPVTEKNRLIENTFDDPRLAKLAPGLKNFIDNRTNLYDPDYNNFAPRIGVAYSPDWFGSKRLSVIRAGYGIFYDQILGSVISQSRNVFPTYYTVNFGGLKGTGTVPLFFVNPAYTSFPTNQNQVLPFRVPGTVNTFNSAISLEGLIQYLNSNFPNAITATLPAKKLEMPMAHHYTIGFEQQLTQNYIMSIAYVGTAGRKLLRFTTPNLGSSITVAPTQLFSSPTNTTSGVIPFVGYLGQVYNPNRPVNSIGAVNLFETNASSIYNSLQAQFKGRLPRELNFQFSYVYSKVSDDVSDVFDLAGASALPQNSFDLEGEKGPANFDVRHQFVYDLIYDFPKITKENSFINWLTNDLQIASTGRFHTGQPFTVNSTIDVNLDGNLTDRLNSTTGLEVTGDGRQPLRLTTDNTLSLLAPFGQNGQVGRNSFRAGKFLDLDLSIIKQFAFGDHRVSFRTDIFNFINRANFGIPIRLLEAPGFGKATNTVIPGRRVQFSLKYEF